MNWIGKGKGFVVRFMGIKLGTLHSKRGVVQKLRGNGGRQVAN
jgi:hypothetical protein